jgi:hypothetical protein
MSVLDRVEVVPFLKLGWLEAWIDTFNVPASKCHNRARPHRVPLYNTMFKGYCGRSSEWSASNCS